MPSSGLSLLYVSATMDRNGSLEPEIMAERYNADYWMSFKTRKHGLLS